MSVPKLLCSYTTPRKGTSRQCSGTVTLNSLFMSLFICLLDVIFVAATISAVYMTTCCYIGFGSIQRLVNPSYLSLLSNLIRNTQRCVTLEGKQGTFHLYDVNFPSRPTPLWLI